MTSSVRGGFRSAEVTEKIMTSSLRRLQKIIHDVISVKVSKKNHNVMTVRGVSEKNHDVISAGGFQKCGGFRKNHDVISAGISKKS